MSDLMAARKKAAARNEDLERRGAKAIELLEEVERARAEEQGPAKVQASAITAATVSSHSPERPGPEALVPRTDRARVTMWPSSLT